MCAVKSNRKIAVILKLWQNFDRGILQGIAAYACEHRRWSVFVEECQEQRIPNLHEWDGDGLIVNFDDRNIVRALTGIRQKVVAVGGGKGWHDPASGIPYVATDDLTIGRLAAEHLLDRGLKQFAFCGYPPTRTNVWMRGRAEGFAKRLAEAGYSCRMFAGRYGGGQHWERLQSELVAWLRRLPTPIGLLGCYDYRARHVLEACKRAGLRVPEDVAVIGVDNDVVCDLTDPPLTSVEQGRFQIGYTAAKVLDRLMAGGAARPLRYVIPPVGLVCRQSTDLLYVADRRVAEALRIIREQACHGLQAQAVAGLVQCSRSTLDKQFRQSLGWPVDQEIRRVRLARARELLARTDLPLRAVAREAGYANEQYLSAVIRKELRCTPFAYRQNHRNCAGGRAI